MSRPTDEDRLLSLVPVDGSIINNRVLREQLAWPDEKYERVRDRLVEKGLLLRGPGQGGTVRRAEPEETSDDEEPDKEEGGAELSRRARKLLALIPHDGSTINNRTLREELGWPDETYDEVREQLVEKGLIVRGPGQGGTVRRAEPEEASDEEEPDEEEGSSELSRREKRLLALIPHDGSTINNRTLREELGWPDETYDEVREQLVEKGLIVRGPGQGGTVRRAEPEDEAIDEEEQDEEQEEVSVDDDDEEQLLSLLPQDGSSKGNRALCKELRWGTKKYEAARDQLVEKGLLVRGPGPGGTVRLTEGEERALLAQVPDDYSAISGAAIIENLAWPEARYIQVRDRLIEKGLLAVPPGRGRGASVCLPGGPKPQTVAATPKPRSVREPKNERSERSTAERPVKIFLAYAQSDEPLKRSLLDHLRPLEKGNLIEIWHDHMITPGEDWRGAIHKQLREAEIILFLVSTVFLNSEYCNGDEMKTALDRHERGQAIVIPIIIRPCMWHLNKLLIRLRALPRNNQPVTKWLDLDDALTNVAEGIYEAVQKLTQKR